MAAVFAPAEEVARIVAPMADRVAIAAVNAPDSVVVSGEAAAVDAVLAFAKTSIEQAPRAFREAVDQIARSGGTPLAVADGEKLLGVVHLKDVVKPDIKARFAALRAMGLEVTESVANFVLVHFKPGEAAKADYSLRVDVTRFEAVYDQGPKAAPMIVVSLRVALTKADRTLAGSDLIEAQVRASDNRVSAIVEAFDQAVGQALNGLVAWTNRTGAGA